MRTKYNLCRALMWGSAVALLAAALAPMPAHAETLRQAGSNSGHAPAIPGNFSVTYYDVKTGGLDNNVNVVNPTKANGSICAMFYIFDSSEEMGECCGCPITPNDRLTGGVVKDFLSN